MPCIARESGFLLGMCAMRATSTRGFLVNVPFANRENARPVGRPRGGDEIIIALTFLSPSDLVNGTS